MVLSMDIAQWKYILIHHSFIMASDTCVIAAAVVGNGRAPSCLTVIGTLESVGAKRTFPGMRNLSIACEEQSCRSIVER